MAAPATTARSTPLGIMMDDGFSTKIAFARDVDFSIWEVTITPPSIDGGDTVPFTTMHNTTWRTFASRGLFTLGEVSGTAGYDPDAYDEAQSLINFNGSITVHFPDLSTLDFFGYLRVFEPQEMSDGGEVRVNFTIQPTNWDSTNNVESGPVMTEIAGT